MKKQLLFGLFLCMGALLSAQSVMPDIATAHMAEHASDMGLETSDLLDTRVSDMYTSQHNGVTHVYLQQQYGNIDVYGAITTVNILKDKNVLSAYTRFVSGLSARVTQSTPSISPAAAVEYLTQDLGIYTREALVEAKKSSDLEIVYQPTSYSQSQIRVHAVYLPVGDAVRLAWNVEMDQRGSVDYWNAMIDATSGAILAKYNYTVKCSSGDHSHSHTAECQPRVMNTAGLSSEAASTVAMGATYNIFALPAESPLHGDRAMVSDLQYPESSPFGWHTTIEGGEPTLNTTTQGNNVTAYADQAGDNTMSAPQPDGGDALIFDYTYDESLEPAGMLDAAITNLFYMNNMMHDLTYLYGFTEDAGNFQGSNFEFGGNGNDRVIAEGLDGSGTNNANFATPPDGANGRMQMFLWNASAGVFFGSSPEEIAQGYEVGLPSDWGPGITDVAVEGSLAIVDDGTQNGSFGCEPLINSDDVAGKIAFVDRGGCFFSLKAKQAQDAGAIGVIICNFEEGVINMAGGDDGSGVGITIPAVMLQNSDCSRIKMLVEEGVNVVMRFEDVDDGGASQLGGSFDNGIIAHEYGHGISNRLTGGPSTGSCLNNDEQMGEGWSDFFTLVTTVEPGDNGTDRRGIGNYATSSTVLGNGIRSAPYSTDMAVYPNTHIDIIGTAAPHPLGEVWAGTLWDLYWNLVDEYGYDADWRNMESGNAIAVQLVMDGMKMQSCSPGFLDGRDAIIDADQANNEGRNFCLIWNTFARRGFGFFADQGSSNDRNDQTEDFTTFLPCLGKMLVTKSAEGVITPGDDVDVVVSVANYKFETAVGVVVTEEVPEGTSVVDGSISDDGTLTGNMITWSLGDMEVEEERELTYTLATPETQMSTTLFIDDFENGEDNWLPDLPSSTGANIFFLDDDRSKSGDFSYFIPNLETASDAAAFLFEPIALDVPNPVLRFWTTYETQAGFDGGVVEVSADGGTTWTFVDESQTFRNGYPSPIDYSTFVIPNLEAFTGTSDGWVDVFVDLAAWQGEDILVRYRFGTDATVSSVGWSIDDVEIMDMLAYQSDVCVMSDAGDEGCASWDGKGIIVDSDLTVGTSDQLDDISWSVYPNPASDVVHVEINAQTITSATVSLLTVDGRELQSQKVQLQDRLRLQLSVQDIPTGVYMVRIATDSGQEVQKLVIAD